MEWWMWALLGLVVLKVIWTLGRIADLLSRIVGYLDATDELYGVTDRLVKVRELDREIQMSDYALGGERKKAPPVAPGD